MQSSENVSILSSRNNRLKISASRAVKVKVFSPQSHLHSFKLCSVTHCGMAIHFYLLPFLLNCWCYNWFQNTKNQQKLDLVKNGLNDQNGRFCVPNVTKNRLIRTKLSHNGSKTDQMINHWNIYIIRIFTIFCPSVWHLRFSYAMWHKALDKWPFFRRLTSLFLRTPQIISDSNSTGQGHPRKIIIFGAALRKWIENRISDHQMTTHTGKDWRHSWNGFSIRGELMG